MNLEVIRRAWPRILKLVEQVSKSANVFLQKAEVCALHGQIVEIRFRESLACERIEKKGRELVEKKINEGLKTQGYKIRCVMDGQDGGGPPPGGPPPPSGSPVRAPTSPAPTNGAGATLEMGTLLDAPLTAPAQPSRLMDIDRPAPPISPPTGSNGASQPMSMPEPAKPANTGLVNEVMNLFGGQIVKSEKT